MNISQINQVSYKHNPHCAHSPNCAHNPSKKRKFNPLVLASTIIGAAIPIILLRNRQDAFVKSVVNLDYNLKNILAVGLGSITGGLLGGVISDKGKNTDKKIQEGIYQGISNIIIPTVLVDGALKLLKNNNVNNKFIKAGVTIAGVMGGMTIGNFISGKINKKLFPNNHVKRKMHLKDTLVHIDDLPTCLALNKQKFFHIEKLVPIGHILSGYETGIQ